MVLSQAFLRQKNLRSEGGFSLIEVAIALMVIALLMLPIIRTYSLYIERKKTIITNGVVNISRAAVLKFFEKNGVYPIPANPSAAQGTAGFGQPAVIPVTGWPTCTATSTTVCRTPGYLAGSFVLIGDVPFAALGITYKSVLDGYGKKLKYAVTLSQTTLPFNEAAGAIEVTNSANISIYGAGTIPRSHFVVVSHGPNGSGAFTIGGVRPTACIVSGTIPDESQNCNNDSTFRNNLDAVAGTNKPLIFNGAGARQFDDVLATTNTSSYGLWSYIPNTAMNMQSRNEGNVKIGCTGTPCVAPLPLSKVDVQGNVRATAIQTSRFCSSSEANCTSNVPSPTPRALVAAHFFSPTMLTGAPAVQPSNVAPNAFSSEGGTVGAGIRCYDDSALKGIRNYDEVCAQSTVSGTGMTSAARLTAGSYVGGDCPAAQYAVGISINPAGKFSFICAP